MTTTTIRARAFTNYPVEEVRVMVESDGRCLVWDDVAGYYTRCHILSESAKRRARRATGHARQSQRRET